MYFFNPWYLIKIFKDYNSSYFNFFSEIEMWSDMIYRYIYICFSVSTLPHPQEYFYF